MEYKKINCESYNIHTIKTDKFKTTRMEIIFSREVEKEKMQEFTFLSDILTDSSKHFQRRKDIAIRLEELYKAIFYGTTNKVGNLFTISFVLEFINPEYISEDNYFEEILSFPFKILNNPRVKNKEFDITNYNIVKRRMEDEIKSIKESSEKLAILSALQNMDPNSPSSFKVLGEEENLKNITTSSLYETYNDLFMHSNCDIFIIGNINMDKAVKIIKDNFKYRVIKIKKPSLLVDNKIKRKPLIVNKEVSFVQSTLVMIYNLKGLDIDLKNVAFHVFNYIFASGGIQAKLYQRLRVENSLCYSVKSLYLKYDELLVIEVSLDKKNIKMAEKLIKKCVKEMINGKYSQDELNDAKKNLVFSLKMANDNNVSILNNYIFNQFAHLPLIDERIKLIKKVTKEDLIKCAKALKLNTVYVQCPSDNGGVK